MQSLNRDESSNDRKSLESDDAFGLELFEGDFNIVRYGFLPLI